MQLNELLEVIGLLAQTEVEEVILRGSDTHISYYNILVKALKQIEEKLGLPEITGG
jgi:hypothetical protein